MKKTLQFRLQSLLSKTGEIISGPMSPLLFAKDMAKEMGFKFNRLSRVLFKDEAMLQCREEGTYTGFDHLLIATRHSNDLWLSLWVDMGVRGLPVAMVYESDRNLIISPQYKEARFAKKIDQRDIETLFEFVFTHPEVLSIHEN